MLHIIYDIHFPHAYDSNIGPVAHMQWQNEVLRMKLNLSEPASLFTLYKGNPFKQHQ